MQNVRAPEDCHGYYAKKIKENDNYISELVIEKTIKEMIIIRLLLRQFKQYKVL